MTVLRRIGLLVLVPGVPGKPAVPGYSRLIQTPDPPPPEKVNFNGLPASIPVHTVFGKAMTVVIQSSGGSSAGGGNGYPPRPGIQEVQSYNGTKGEYAVITGADGTVKVVKL